MNNHSIVVIFYLFLCIGLIYAVCLPDGSGLTCSTVPDRIITETVSNAVVYFEDTSILSFLQSDQTYAGKFGNTLDDCCAKCKITLSCKSFGYVTNFIGNLPFCILFPEYIDPSRYTVSVGGFMGNIVERI
jgi:hypothetical protein